MTGSLSGLCDKALKQKGKAMIRISRYLLAQACLSILLTCLLASPVCAQISSSTASFEQAIGQSYTHTRWFPNIAAPYVQPHVPPFQLRNSPLLDELIQNGVMHLSLSDAITLAIENNLNIAVDRYNPEYAVIDKVRTESGQANRNINGMFVSSALFSGALGGGISAASSGFASSGEGGTGASGVGLRAASAVGSYDPVIGISGAWGYSVTPLDNAIINGTNILTGNLGEYNVFFGQEFPTGTSYEISVGGLRQSINALDYIYNPEVTTGLTIGIAQNLLSGFGYRANAKYIRIATNEIGISKDYFMEQITTTIQQVINDYWTLVQDKENVDVAQEAVNYNQQLVRQNQEQVRIGTLAPSDVVQAQSALAAAQQTLITSQITYRKQQEAMKTDIAKKVGPPLITAQIHPTDTLPKPEDNPVPPVEVAVDEAHKNRPEVDLDELNLKNEAVVLKANRNSLLPTLNAFATYGPSGLAGLLSGGASASQFAAAGIVPGGLGANLSQLLRNRYPSYSAGFTLAITIKNRAAQADAARALLEQHYLRTVSQQDLNNIDQAVRQADVGVTLGQEGIAAAQNAEDYARKQYMNEQKKFRLGESTVALVIQMQNSLTQAEGQLVTSQYNYAQSLVQFEDATGTLLQKNNIVLTDALTGAAPHPRPNIPGTPVSENLGGKQ
jgi:outer membrane protein